MRRVAGSLTVGNLRGEFFEIEFPEYQREPDVWSREQKQRLVDSVLRGFDISSIYFYRREGGVLECIDGRQRLNALMSFMAANDADERDNGFPIRFTNEISSDLPNRFETLDGKTFAEIEQLATEEDATAKGARKQILDYALTAVYLSEATEPNEFNLQFLRLNLGTLINAGEKLNAMVGGMRDMLFEPDGIGRHPFFELVKIPTRRYAKEQAAAQILLQAFSFSKASRGEFTRARHFDLQRFLKAQSGVTASDPTVASVSDTLDALVVPLQSLDQVLRNRAITVSVVLLAWERQLGDDPQKLVKMAPFLEAFIGRLRWQVANMKNFSIDENYAYLVEFQRHVTQASVEKPAVTRRHELLAEAFDLWVQTGDLPGDVEYRKSTNEEPPVR